MKNCYLLLLLVFMISLAFAAKLPSSFQLCKQDGNINKCLKMAIPDALIKMANGVPELGATPLEPLTIPSFSISGAGGSVGVEEQKHTNMKIYNLTSSKLEHINTTSTKEKFESDMVFYAPEMRIESHYNFKGRILVLPIDGKGESTIIFKNLTINVHLFADAVERKGKFYYRLKDFSFTFQPEKAIYDFENLINGNARLSAETNKVLNENWKQLLDDVKPSYQEALSSVFKAYANNIFSKIEIKKLFLQ